MAALTDERLPSNQNVEVYVTSVPDTGLHRIGFRNAHVCQTIILVTLGFMLGSRLPVANMSTHFHFCYPIESPVLAALKVIVSAVALDSFWDVFAHLFLWYCFRSTERHWGSAKFALFLVWTHCLSAFAMVMLLGSEDQHRLSRCLPGGLIGPMFAIAITQFDKHSHEGLFTTSISSIVLSKKFIVAVTCLQILTVNQATIIYGCIGMLVGALYHENVLRLRSLGLPRRLRDQCNDVCGFQKSNHRACMLGATLEIHDDILYDYTTRSGQWMPGSLQGSMASLFSNGRNSGRHQGVQSSDGLSSHDSSSSSHNPSESKINALVDMGFPRLAAVDALQRSSDNLEIASEMLLAQI